MIGIELVKDKKTKEPLEPEKVAEIFEKTKDLGLLIGKGGFSGNVFRMAPSMNITKEDCEFALYVLEKSLQ